MCSGDTSGRRVDASPSFYFVCMPVFDALYFITMPFYLPPSSSPRTPQATPSNRKLNPRPRITMGGRGRSGKPASMPPPSSAVALAPQPSSKTKKKKSKNKRNVVQEFSDYFGSADRLDNWQMLCEDLGLGVPSSITGCKKVRLCLGTSSTKECRKEGVADGSRLSRVCGLISETSWMRLTKGVFRHGCSTMKWNWRDTRTRQDGSTRRERRRARGL